MLLVIWALWSAVALAGPCDTLAEQVLVSHLVPELRRSSVAPVPVIPASPAVASLPPVGPDFPRPTPMVGIGDGVALVHEGRVLLVQGEGVVGTVAVEGVEALVAPGPDRLLTLGHAPGSAPPMDRAVLLDTSDLHQPRLLETLDVQGQIGLAGAVGDEVWLVVSGRTGLSAVHHPLLVHYDQGPPSSLPSLLDRPATLLQAQLTLGVGLLRARVNGEERRLVRCEALGLVGNPEALTALVRLPRDGGEPQVDAVLGAAQVMAGASTGVAVAIGDQIVRWTPDGRRRRGGIPGQARALAPAGDGVVAVWSRVYLDDEGAGVEISPPEAGLWGLSALLPQGDGLVEAIRTPLGEQGVHPTGMAITGREAVLTWPQHQVRVPIGPGEVQVSAPAPPSGVSGDTPAARTSAASPTGARPGEPAFAAELAAEHPALREAHARLLGDDGTWYTARQPPRWIGAWPIGDGFWVASAGGLTRIDAQGREIQAVPLMTPTLNPAPTGWTFAPTDWSVSRVARFGVGDAGDVATCVDGDEVWVAADGALRRLKGSRLRKISSFEGFLRGLACGGGQVLVATRVGGVEGLLHLKDGQLVAVTGPAGAPTGGVGALASGPEGPWVALNGPGAGVWALEAGQLVSRWSPAPGEPFEARGLAVGPGGDFALSWAGGAGSGGIVWRRHGELRSGVALSSPVPGRQGWSITQLDEVTLAAGRLWFFAQVASPGGRARALLASDAGGALELIAAPGQALAAGGAAVVSLGGLSPGPGDRLVLDAIFAEGPGTLLLEGGELVPVLGPPDSRPRGSPPGSVWADGPAPMPSSGQVLLWASEADGHLSLWSAARAEPR